MSWPTSTARRDTGEEPFAEEPPARLDDPELSTDEQKLFRQELVTDPGLHEAIPAKLSGPTPLPQASQQPHRIGRAVLAEVVRRTAKRRAY